MKTETIILKSAKEFKEFLNKVKIMPTMFNRRIRESHVKKMAESVREIGVQRAINIIFTSCFGDGLHYYIGDGQHLRLGIALISNAKLFGHFTIHINHINSRDEIIPFVTWMNSTASNWGMRDYLNSWVTHGLEDYKFLQNIHEETGYGISPLVEAYLNRRSSGNVTFKKGFFVAKRRVGNRTLNLYKSAVSMGLKDCNSSFLAFVRFCVDHSTLDEAYMLSNIQKLSSLFGGKFNREGYLTLLRTHCKMLN